MAEIQYYSQDDSSDFEKVIEMTDELFDNDYDDSSINFYRARAHQSLDQPNCAIPFYINSISLSNDVIEGDYSWTKIQSSHNLANIYFDLDLYDKCIDICQNNINFFRSDSRMLSNKLFYTNALYLTAHCHYLKATHFPPSDPDSMLGRMIQMQKTEIADKGLVLILEALEIIPDNVDFLFVTGMLYKIKSDLQQARICFTKAANLGDSASKSQLGKL